MTTTLTTTQLQAARQWLADCLWGDMEPEDFEAIPEARVLRGLARHYDGGITGFLMALGE